MVISRDEVEKDVTFLGFLIMQNKLKSATVKAIQELNEANIRTIMATGDNMLTALSVGRKCGIIEENKTVYLGDLVGDNEDLNWRIAKDSGDVVDIAVDSDHAINDYGKLFPWEGLKDIKESDIAIAVTGKMFNKLVRDPSLTAIK